MLKWLIMNKLVTVIAADNVENIIHKTFFKFFGNRLATKRKIAYQFLIDI